MKKYAVFSLEQSKITGIFQWRIPDGRIVDCTSIGYEKGCPECKLSDKIDLGEVEEFVKIFIKPEISNFNKNYTY